MHLSIRDKIILPFAALLLFVGVIGTAIASSELANAAAAQFDASLLHNSLTANEALSQLDAARTADLRLATDTIGVSESLASNDITSAARLLTPVVGNVAASSPTLWVVDSKGAVILEIQKTKSGPAIVPAAGPSFSLQADVMQALLAAPGADRRVFVWRQGNTPMLVWAGAIRLSGDQTVGAALLGESLNEIASNTSGTAFYDPSGSLLATQLPQPPKLTSSVRTHIPSDKAYPINQALGGQSYEALFSTWMMRGRQVGYLAVQANRAPLIALRDQSRLLLTLLFTAAAILTLLVGAATASFLTRPIEALMQSMRTVSSGDLQHRAQVHSRDEIGYLAKTFNDMTSSLEAKSVALEKTAFAAIEALARAIDARDPMTFGHSERVAAISVEIADAMFMPDKEKEALRRAALMHDLGKIGVGDKVLHKPGPLSQTEADEMREHSQIGYDVLKGLPFLKSSLPGVLYHHERWDGGGYPIGLSGTAIPLQVRILSVADVLDALTSDRPYRQGLHFDAAVSAIRSEAGLQFDPDVVTAFLSRQTQIEQLLDKASRYGVSGTAAEAA
jgi:HD-GYP domain-containing protein (c-di-GMP phosphodiesterase class II)